MDPELLRQQRAYNAAMSQVMDTIQFGIRPPRLRWWQRVWLWLQA